MRQPDSKITAPGESNRLMGTLYFQWLTTKTAMKVKRAGLTELLQEKQ